MFGKNEWLFYVVLAGLSWGTYVPLIFYGGGELGGKPAARILAILCVGVAYFAIAVVFPLIYLYQTAPEQRPSPNANGLIFASLAGVAGAIGALCVIFATKAAVAQSGPESGVNYKLYIGPLIFGLAPIINTLVSTVWLPQKGEPFHFGFHAPGWKLWVGILLVGVGAALVLFSKEESESKPKAAHAPAPVAATSPEAPR